ncbi:MAG: hypothetical protein JNN08_20590 [Bryobacterales bacterium]|nr:hypothetical protein [Bryobacterales bacterium]
MLSSSRIDAAEWLTSPSPSLSVVPDGFPAYVRIPHAGSEPGNLPSSLLAIVSPYLASHTTSPHACWFCLWDGYGWLHEGSHATIQFIHSSAAPEPAGPETPFPSTPFRHAALHAPRVRLPFRDYLLFQGPLHAAAEFGWHLTATHFIPQSPNLFWPDDHAWCVASEIDLDYTLIAGSAALAQALLADPHLKALPASTPS